MEMGSFPFFYVAAITFLTALLLRSFLTKKRRRLPPGPALAVPERQKQQAAADEHEEEQGMIGVMLSLQKSEPDLYTDTFIAALVALHGYDVAAGTIVLVNAYAIHRDPAEWGPAPEEFRPERFEHGGAEGKLMMSFGMGRRKCPGESLAMRTMGMVLGTLIQCFDWKRVGDEEVDMAASSGIVMFKAVALEALCTPRAGMETLLHKL
ncbi:unnamed protein product [Triticum turgidum subsp. durum]|uniref:Uncharacterized protein n=1 Tax=Triticum turgidum subsp. durum TaxID=4567 RepID=A0A9R1PPW6_TRITD|nr:unnamed protein product [Triticum turgidum subsp. durum]